DESELRKLSAAAGQGKAVRVSDDLWNVLSRAQELSERSGGAFDATVGPLVQLWRKARRIRVLPPGGEIAKARRAVGWKNVRLDEKRHTVELLAPGMKLDLGGVAKGYAAGEAIRV